MSISRRPFGIRRVRHGLRLSQHGVVLSELRTAPGPTHSVFDVLAALIAELAPASRTGVLGFAGGSLLAPLRALGFTGPVAAVDRERAGYDLFRRHCAAWAGQVRWQRADAAAWLRSAPADFGLLLEDLSVVADRDVIKPALTWAELPELIRDRLQPDGVAVFNLLLPPGGRWRPALARIARLFREARLVELADFENRILIASLRRLPPAGQLSRSVRSALRRIGSRQAGRLRLHGFLEDGRPTRPPRAAQ